ncbi:hypothetical protein STSP2_03259 [Anaerohalosphaera lusitana]|uniref:DUF2958 domain-containing protein n=1 Tax=Anaerohalosphaera lusitana TaxID=1936003 RepID=A0A1U9NQK0_9BACT|nr:DUF2958 domain-containing protein [Anaerohalosphaera lusitana]AQT70057.1 hypothetical protein STSP2_03259 [Anaerohalosphaera lusitana]
MKLLTEEIKRTLPKLYSQEEVTDPMVPLKFFTPDSSFTWLIIEGDEESEGDWLFFCKVVSHLCPEGELGYVRLSDLEEIRGPLGLPVERDLYWEAKPLSKCK